jgi:AraC-like DNA-binding protein
VQPVPDPIPRLPSPIPFEILEWVEGLFDRLNADAFFAKDRAGRFIAANEAFVRLLRRREKRFLLGKTDLDFFPRHIALEYQRDDQAVMRTGQPLLHKLEVVPTDDLTLEWREVHKFPMKNADGEVVGLAGITLKVSDGAGAHLADPSLGPVLDFIARHYGERILVEDLARLAGLSVRTLERRFHDCFQSSPLRYLKQVRLNAACHALGHTHKPIAEIAMDCGFSDQSHLNKEFARTVGETPRRYRQRLQRS